MQYTGVHVFREQNPRAWWWFLIGVNACLLVLLPIVVLPLAVNPRMGVVVALVFAVVVLVIVNAVIVPICAVNLRKRIAFDFDRGIASSGSVGFAASDFVALVHRRRFMGPDLSGPDTLCIRYRGGQVMLKVWSWRDPPEITARNEAAIAFIWRWLQAPEHARVQMFRTASAEEHAIGRQEALALLRRGTGVPVVWPSGG